MFDLIAVSVIGILVLFGIAVLILDPEPSPPEEEYQKKWQK